MAVFQDLGSNLGKFEDFQEDLRAELDSGKAQADFKCKCKNKTSCKCCGKLHLPRIKLKKKACLVVTYNGRKTALTLAFSMNNKLIFSITASANNPLPICVGLPNFSVIADLCFEFYDVQIFRDKFHFCLTLRPRIMMKEIARIKVGCFTFKNEKRKPVNGKG
ncbi:DUF4773 domain-containing protein [Trichonephila clavata]|uniref:DUF4773 domain-containing protein n=1 Tax=Trichonephila clavata TaxID=2740835 RepID=A0A8X6GP20_TRICU|nr:DUF4773 domain-containing protein [Trichonephila clavata]